MATREDFLRSLIPSLSNTEVILTDDNLAPPPPEVVALNRMTYGAIPKDVGRVRAIGLSKFIDEQLNPTNDEGDVVRNKLAAFMLPIKYQQRDSMTPDVEEERPLSLLNAPLDKLWELSDFNTHVAGERIRGVEEVRAASWIRAVHSPWQLKEILVEFWHNHFSVNFSRNQRIALVFPVYDRDVIRKNCLGNFRAFLEAVAKSTAMLYYLDNFNSKASPANENYARELFELHTLGSDYYFNNLYNRWREVPGAAQGKPIGYIDEDVYEAARAFTGWTIADGTKLGGRDVLPNTGEFYYYDGWHDNYQKRVLGVEFDPNQPPMADGLKVLDLVAYHPATAKNICKKLCRRFIADEPPQNVINGAVKVWTRYQKSPDQIKETVRYILSTREFTAMWGKKIKRPFDLIVSMFRAGNGEFINNANLTNLTPRLAQMGYMHYQWSAPTGHPDTSSYWLSSNAMLVRWNSASFLLSPYNKMFTYNFRAETPPEIKTFRDTSDYWVKRVLQTSKSPAFFDAMAEFLTNKNKPTDEVPERQFNERVGGLLALLAMTPDFQLK